MSIFCDSPKNSVQVCPLYPGGQAQLNTSELLLEQFPPLVQGLLQQALQSPVHGSGHVQVKLPMVFVQFAPPSQASMG